MTWRGPSEPGPAIPRSSLPASFIWAWEGLGPAIVSPAGWRIEVPQRCSLDLQPRNTCSHARHRPLNPTNRSSDAEARREAEFLAQQERLAERRAKVSQCWRVLASLA